MKKILSVALAFMLFTVAAQAQTRDTVRKHKGNREMAVSQLNLSEDQKAKLKAIRENQRNEMKSLKDASLSAEQQKARREELHKKYNEQVQSVYTPAQKAQLEQMKGEWKSKAKEGKKPGKKDGMSKDRKGDKGFRKGGDFAKDLNLTADQKERMEKMRSASKSEFESVKNDKNLSDDQKKAKMQELRKQQHEQMKSILTAEQLEKMKSKKKDHSKKVTR